MMAGALAEPVDGALFIFRCGRGSGWMQATASLLQQHLHIVCMMHSAASCTRLGGWSAPQAPVTPLRPHACRQLIVASPTLNLPQQREQGGH